MKYLSLVFLVLLMSCGDQPLSETIVGTWKLETMSITDCPNPSDDVAVIAADVDGCLVINAVDVCQTIVFNTGTNGTSMTITNGVPVTDEVTYSVNNETNAVTSCDLGGNCRIFSVVNDKILLTSDFGDCKINTTYIKL